MCPEGSVLALIHGVIYTRIAHAWLRKGDWIYDPVEYITMAVGEYERTYHAKAERAYVAQEANAMTFRTDTGAHGMGSRRRFRKFSARSRKPCLQRTRDVRRPLTPRRVQQRHRSLWLGCSRRATTSHQSPARRESRASWRILQQIASS